MEAGMKRKRLLLLAAAAVVVVTLTALYFLGTVLLTLGISAVIAYVLLPVARLLERGMPWRNRHPDLSRVIAVGVIFLAGLAILTGVLIAVIPPTIQQSQRFIDGFPGFFNSARVAVEGWIIQHTDLVPQEVRDFAEKSLADAGGILGRAAWNAASQTWGVILGPPLLAMGKDIAVYLSPEWDRPAAMAAPEAGRSG